MTFSRTNTILHPFQDDDDEGASGSAATGSTATETSKTAEKKTAERTSSQSSSSGSRKASTSKDDCSAQKDDVSSQKNCNSLSNMEVEITTTENGIGDAKLPADTSDHVVLVSFIS